MDSEWRMRGAKTQFRMRRSFTNYANAMHWPVT